MCVFIALSVVSVNWITKDVMRYVGMNIKYWAAGIEYSEKWSKGLEWRNVLWSASSTQF